MKKIFTLCSALFLTGSAFAQIPNPGFENWTTVGAYDSAWSWGTPNYITSALSVYTVEKGTTGAPVGSSFIKMTSKTTLLGVVPGVAVTGTVAVSGTSYSVSGGFPYTTRAASITGQYQYMASATTDHPHIVVFLSKWNIPLNKRDTVAFIDTALQGMAMSWASFTIPLKYYSGKTPDSAMVILSSSGATGAVAGSYMYIDDLALTGSVPSSVTTVSNTASETAIYPNPASTKTTLFCSRNNAGKMSVTITDLTGKVIRQIDTKTAHGINEISIDLSGIAQGMYFVNAIDEQGTETKKLIIE